MTTECFLCGATQFSAVLTITAPDRFERAAGVAAAGYRRQWLQCHGCGMLLNSRGGAQLQQLYRTDYYSREVEGEDVPERFARVMALPPERSDNSLRARRVAEFVVAFRGGRAAPDPRHALDIGSGSGVFPARLHEHLADWHLTAVEPHPSACAHLRTLPAINSVVEAYFRPGLLTQTYELVTLNKVLEHVEAPIALLQAAAANLDPCAGILYLEVPDLLTASLRPPTDNILGALHLHLHSPLTVCKLLQRAGLQPLQVQRLVEPSGKITVFGFAARTEACALWGNEGTKHK